MTALVHCVVGGKGQTVTSVGGCVTPTHSGIHNVVVVVVVGSPNAEAGT